MSSERFEAGVAVGRAIGFAEATSILAPRAPFGKHAIDVLTANRDNFTDAEWAVVVDTARDAKVQL
jgi:hypothetical protein